MTARSSLDVRRAAVFNAIPLPARPGTTWSPTPGANDGCAACGADYRGHGAPSDVAAALGVDEARRHLVCPAPEAAWTEYRDARRRADVDALRVYLFEQLDGVSLADRAALLAALDARYDHRSGARKEEKR